jgi:hypothetical protein
MLTGFIGSKRENIDFAQDIRWVGTARADYCGGRW